MPSLFRSIVLGMLAMSAPLALASAQTLAPKPAAAKPAPILLRSTPDNVIRGEINNTRAPVLHIKSGQTVKIDTVSHAGVTDDPVAYFGAAGIAAKDILKDVIDISAASKAKGRGYGGHVLTGPVYIDGAEPGDLLEIRIIKIDPRVPYGVNNAGPGGAAPDLVKARSPHIIKFDMKRRVALFSKTVEVPLAPFMGIMAVAPSPEAGGKTSSRPPGSYGGNMDMNRLTDGSTLYLPVFNPGALFYTGDSHAVQGDGEVDGTAIEASMAATLQFIVHKGAGKDVKFPMAEDKANFYVMGMDPDLDKALTSAITETVGFLGRKAGMSPGDGYSLASIGINFSVAEAVDQNLVVYGTIPKKLFKAPISMK